MKSFHKLASVALAGTLAFSLSAGTALAAANTNAAEKLPWLENNGHDLSKEEPPADGNYWVFRGDSDGLTKSTIYVTNRRNGGDPQYSAAVIKLDKDGKPVVTLANQPTGMRVLYEETDPICDDGGEACFTKIFKKEIKIGGTISPQAQLGNNDLTITIERKDPSTDQSVPNKVEGKMRIVVKSMSDKYEPELVGNAHNTPLSLKPGVSLTDASIRGFIRFKQYAKAGTLKEGKAFDGDPISLPDGAAFTYPEVDASKYGVQQIPVTVTYEDKTTDLIKVFVKVSAKAPSQTPVGDPKSLTEDEKKAVEAAVRAANPGLPVDAKIAVAGDGQVTITYGDGSEDTLSADQVVRAKTTAEKTEVAQPAAKMLSKTGAHHLGAILIIAVSLIGIGAFAIARRRNDAERMRVSF